MIFLKGLVIGFFVSSLPGPASMSVIEGSRGGSRLKTYQSILALVLCDILIFFLCAIAFFRYQSFVESLPLKAASAIFLIAYALFSLKRKRSQSRSSTSYLKTSLLTFASPGIWILNFALVALGISKGWPETLIYFSGLQVGVVFWFALLTKWICLQSKARQESFQKGCLGLMFILGFFGALRLFGEFTRIL